MSRKTRFSAKQSSNARLSSKVSLNQLTTAALLRKEQRGFGRLTLCHVHSAMVHSLAIVLMTLGSAMGANVTFVPRVIAESTIFLIRRNCGLRTKRKQSQRSNPKRTRRQRRRCVSFGSAVAFVQDECSRFVLFTAGETEANQRQEDPTGTAAKAACCTEASSIWPSERCNNEVQQNQR